MSLTDTNPRHNGRTLRLEVNESGTDMSHGDARLMRQRCEEWLRKNDPTWIASGSFDFGSLSRRKRKAA